MWWLLWIPLWIGALALGCYAADCQQKNTQRMIDNTLKKVVSKPIPNPNPVNPILHKLPTIHKGGQVRLNGVTYKSIIVDNKEYVDIGLYYKALEAFYKASQAAAGNRLETGKNSDI